MIQKLECPHCHQRTIPFWRKLLLGPNRSATCPNCGGEITVPAYGNVVVLPVVGIGGLLTHYTDSFLIASAVLIIVMIPVCWWYHHYVPLIAEDPPTKEESGT